MTRDTDDEVQPVDPWPMLLRDPEFLAALELGKADIAAGRTVRFRDVRPSRFRRLLRWLRR